MLPEPQAFPAAAKDEALVVIATFHEAAGVVGTEAQEEIRQAIQKAAGEAGLANLRVAVEPTRLTADDQAGAQKLGERYHASMVIWGSISGVRVIVNYLNLRQPDFDAASVKISETERTQLANPSAYSSFIAKDLPGQMSFLALFAVGQSYFSQGKYAESIRAIERAVASSGRDQGLEGLAEAYFRLGWLYQAIPDRDDKRAIVNYSKAIELKPDNFAAYTNRGTARYVSGDRAGALADYNRAIELRPDDADAYICRGAARSASDDLAGAIADYDKAIALKPDYARAYTNRGDARIANGDPAGALADYSKTIALEPDYADAYNKRGAARSASGDSPGAIDDCGKAIELKPDFAEAYNNRGIARRASGDLAGALADYNKAIELKPDDAAVYSNRGVARGINGDLAGAIADYTKAIELKPDHVAVYINRGTARSISGDMAGAIADYTKAIELKPDLAALLNSLCWIYALQRQADQALPYCERAVKTDPQPQYLDSRALVYALLGNYPAAINDFQTVIDWAEQHPGAVSPAILARRKGWVEALRANQNPFTPEVLAEFRGAIGTVPR